MITVKINKKALPHAEMGTKIMKKLLPMFVAATFLFVAATACKSEPPPPPKPAAPAIPAPAPAAPAAPAAVTPEAPGQEGQNAEEEAVYTYNPIRPDGKVKRNPFQPIEVSINPEVQYEISQMGVSGVLLQNVKRAALRLPSCATVFISIGDKIGIHDGRAVDISLDGVLVRETFLDIKGRIQEYERLIPNQDYEACK